jgi:hypothetical protein
MCARTSFIAFAVRAIVLSVSPRGADAQHMTPPAVPVMPQAHVLVEMYAKRRWIPSAARASWISCDDSGARDKPR